MTVQSRLARVGLARQTAGKGTPEANPLYAFGLLDGGAVQAEFTQEPEELTLDVLTDPGVNRVAFDPGQEYTARAYKTLTGLFLRAALGAVATSGTGPYTHVFTPATDLDYFTLWGRQGGDYFRLDDARLDELGFTFDGAGPIEMEAVWKALNLTWLAAAFVPTTAVDDPDGKFRGAGGTFQLMTNTDALAVAPIRAGEIRIANNIDQVHLANTIKPSEVPVARKEITVAATVVPSDLLLWRRIFASTAVATAVHEGEVYGSFSYQFVIPGTAHTLTFAADRVALTAPFPEADPGGGAMELEFEGLAVNPAAGDPLTVTLVNDVASY